MMLSRQETQAASVNSFWLASSHFTWGAGELLYRAFRAARLKHIDITAGALGAGLGETPRLTLFIDMGTNGEMVIGSREWLMCCSCSAGPAFEGSGVEYGMYATVGAMERVSYDPGTDQVEYMTIGGGKPRGVCGSGLVDTLATLLRAGAIDRAGRMNLDFGSRRVRVRDERPEFVLVWGEEVGRKGGAP